MSVRIAATGGMSGMESIVGMRPLPNGSHDSNVQLAYENGALTARVASLERELGALRESVVPREEAAERALKRVEAVEAANVALTRMLQVQEGVRSRGGGRFWLLLIAALVLVDLAIDARSVGLVHFTASPDWGWLPSVFGR